MQTDNTDATNLCLDMYTQHWDIKMFQWTSVYIICQREVLYLRSLQCSLFCAHSVLKTRSKLHLYFSFSFALSLNPPPSVSIHSSLISSLRYQKQHNAGKSCQIYRYFNRFTDRLLSSACFSLSKPVKSHKKSDQCFFLRWDAYLSSGPSIYHSDRLFFHAF